MEDEYGSIKKDVDLGVGRREGKERGGAKHRFGKRLLVPFVNPQDLHNLFSA